MKRIMRVIQGLDKILSKYTNFFDRWFIGVKTAKYEMAEGVDYCGPVKKIHKGFFLATFKNIMKDWTGGSYLVMKINTIVHGYRPLVVIRYN